MPFILRFSDFMRNGRASEVLFSTHEEVEKYVDTYLLSNGIKHYTITPIGDDVE